MSNFMGRVKDAVTRELWWPEGVKAPIPIGSALAQVADEDWRRISIGIIRAGGAIVPRSQVRVMANFLRVLEDNYLYCNHMRASTGDFASFTHWRSAEAAVLRVMTQLRDVIDG